MPEGLPDFSDLSPTPTMLSKRPCSAPGVATTPLPPDLDVPSPTRLGEVLWLEPYPDVLLDDLVGLHDSAPTPAPQTACRGHSL